MISFVNLKFIPGYRLLDGSDMQTLLDGVRLGTNSVANTLTATGTNLATALALTKGVNNVTTAAASTGVVLPSSAAVGVGGRVIIYNNGANAIKVYGQGSDTIDGVAGATGVTLTNALRCEYRCIAPNTFLSAKLGATSS